MGLHVTVVGLAAFPLTGKVKTGVSVDEGDCVTFDKSVDVYQTQSLG